VIAAGKLNVEGRAMQRSALDPLVGCDPMRRSGGIFREWQPLLVGELRRHRRCG
jgi:hypothetical protein